MQHQHITALTFSRCGSVLTAGTIKGEIISWDVARVLVDSENEEGRNARSDQPSSFFLSFDNCHWFREKLPIPPTLPNEAFTNLSIAILSPECTFSCRTVFEMKELLKVPFKTQDFTCFLFRMAEDQVKVVLNIKQETFDAYVKENIDDLGLDADEAVQDAIGRG